MKNSPKAPDVSLDDWRRLYTAVEAFRALSPWQWLCDSDLFGIENSENGELFFCTIMGNGGMAYGIAAYRGIEGLAIIEGILDQGLSPEDATYLQNALVMMFGPKSDLNQHDRDIVKALDWKAKPGWWPWIRSQLPGYAPWHLTTDEVKSLIYVLEGVYAAAVELRTNSDTILHDGMSPDAYLVYRKDEVGVWQQHWQVLLDTPPKAATPIPIDEMRVTRMKNKNRRHDGAWEIDRRHMPIALSEGERPYYPRSILIADAGSGFIIDMQLLQPHEDWNRTLIEELLKSMEKTSLIPAEFHITQPELAAALSILESAVGSPVRQMDNLPMVEEARAALATRFR